jgi:hypothetical protein
MARGKFNKRGGGPRLDAVSAEEIELRNNRLAELAEARVARRAEEDEEEEGEDGDLKKVDEDKPTEAAKKPEKKKVEAEKDGPKEPVTSQWEHNKNMARLAEVRRRREVAESRRTTEVEEEENLEEERRKMAAMAIEENEGGKKKKSKEKAVPKLDKIAIKKMKPALLKEALKIRELDIQGNAKQLQQRLLDYEAKR